MLTEILVSALVMYSTMTMFILHVVLWTVLVARERVHWDKARVPLSEIAVNRIEPIRLKQGPSVNMHNMTVVQVPRNSSCSCLLTFTFQRLHNKVQIGRHFLTQQREMGTARATFFL